MASIVAVTHAGPRRSGSGRSTIVMGESDTIQRRRYRTMASPTEAVRACALSVRTGAYVGNSTSSRSSVHCTPRIPHYLLGIWGNKRAIGTLYKGGIQHGRGVRRHERPVRVRSQSPSARELPCRGSPVSAGGLL